MASREVRRGQPTAPTGRDPYVMAGIEQPAGTRGSVARRVRHPTTGLWAGERSIGSEDSGAAAVETTAIRWQS